MSNRTTTSQQFRIQDIPEAAALPWAKPAKLSDVERSRLREYYAGMIARFSSAAERASEDAQFVQRRFAKMMTTDMEYPLRAALSLLAQHQQLTGIEVAVIVAAAERGEIPLQDVRTLLQHPALLPDDAVSTAIRDHVLLSASPFLAPLRAGL